MGPSSMFLTRRHHQLGFSGKYTRDRAVREREQALAVGARFSQQDLGPH